MYVLASKRIAALMDADAISSLDYAMAECREASGEVLASLPKGVSGNYHSIMIPNYHSRVSSRNCKAPARERMQKNNLAIIAKSQIQLGRTRSVTVEMHSP